jgi:2-amino-4-hydroxy-6-hydroxymethyldihydropteridine diphosphokinase
MTKSCIFHLGIGSNLGDREKNIENAFHLLDEKPEIDLLDTASLYETEPVGKVDQPPFLNTVFKGSTTLDCFELLEEIHNVEKTLGRDRLKEVRWGPRTIDIDILLFCTSRIVTENLVVPHPRMKERKFVLVPLLELSPDILHPDTGEPLKKALDTLGEQGVYFYSCKRYSDQAEGDVGGDN